MSIRVLLADDQRLVRSGFRFILEHEPDLDVIGEVENGLMAVQAACAAVPDVVVMDLTMPEMNGIEATRRIKQRLNGISVLILSVHNEKRYVVEALKAGAGGFLPKECAFDELIPAVRAVAVGGKYLSHMVAGAEAETFIASTATAPEGTASALQLSPRERVVLQHIAEGKNTAEIASLLKLSIKTADAYRRQIMRRLNLHSTAELTRFAIREGITPF